MYKIKGSRKNEKENKGENVLVYGFVNTQALTLLRM